MFVLVVATLSERVARESLAGEDRSADLHSKVRGSGTGQQGRTAESKEQVRATCLKRVSLFRFRQMDEPSG